MSQTIDIDTFEFNTTNQL